MNFENKMTIHEYEVKIQWEGNTGTGTSSYRSYKRDFSIQHPQRPQFKVHQTQPI